MEDFVSLSTIIRVTCDYLVNYFRERAAENGWNLYWIDKNKYMTWPTVDAEFLLTANKEGECQKPCILSLNINDFINLDSDDLLDRYKERLLELGIIKEEQVQKEEDSVEGETMEEFVTSIVTILNYQLNNRFKVFAERQKDDIYDIVLLAKDETGVFWSKMYMLATIDPFDRFDLGQRRIIARLKKRIVETNPTALPDAFSEAEKEYLEHDKREVKNLIWHMHVFSVMEEYLNDGYDISISYDPGDGDSDDSVYEIYISSEKTGVRWLTSIKEDFYTVDNFDEVITKIKNAVSFKYPEALKKEEEEMPTRDFVGEFMLSSIKVLPIPGVERVTFSGPATIVFFEDGTKTVAKCHDPEKFDKWAGIAICICKKYYGKNFKKYFKEWDGDKELRKMERKEKKARKKMKNVKTHDDIFRENDKTMEELWIKEEGEDV